jgi:hypothetical protein
MVTYLTVIRIVSFHALNTIINDKKIAYLNRFESK